MAIASTKPPWIFRLFVRPVTRVADEPSDIEILRAGGPAALAEVFSRHSPQLERIVRFRLDRRLYGRVDAADIVQESYIEIAKRVDEFLVEPKVSFLIWARQITWQTLMTAHRQHFNVQKRDVAREVALNVDRSATSFCLASKLVASMTSPSQAAIREERVVQLREALEKMDATDREVLALRHFEHLTNKEVSEVLGIKKTAASNRYVRAIERLREVLDSVMNDNDA